MRQITETLDERAQRLLAGAGTRFAANEKEEDEDDDYCIVCDESPCVCEEEYEEEDEDEDEDEDEEDDDNAQGESQRSQLRAHLKRLGACREAIAWIADRTPQQAWDECERSSWLMWWAGSTNVNTLENIKLAGLDCARAVLGYVPQGEDRPRLAVEAGVLCVAGPTDSNRKAAARAAVATERLAAKMWAAAETGAVAWAPMVAAAWTAEAALWAAWAAAAGEAARAAGEQAEAAAKAVEAATRATRAVEATGQLAQICNIIRTRLRCPYQEGG